MASGLFLLFRIGWPVTQERRRRRRRKRRRTERCVCVSSTDVLKLEVRIGRFCHRPPFLSLSISVFVNKSRRVEHLATEHSAPEQGRNPSSLSSELPPFDRLRSSPLLPLPLPLPVSSAGSANCSRGWGALVCHSRPVHTHLWVMGSNKDWSRVWQLLFFIFLLLLLFVCVCVCVCVCFQSLGGGALVYGVLPGCKWWADVSVIMTDHDITFTWMVEQWPPPNTPAIVSLVKE